MARFARVVVVDVPHHVTQRGNGGWPSLSIAPPRTRVPHPFDSAQGRLLRSLQGWESRTLNSWGLDFAVGVRVAHPFAEDAKGWGTHCAAIHGGIKSLGRLAQPFRLLSRSGTRVPHPFDSAQGRLLRSLQGWESRTLNSWGLDFAVEVCAAHPFAEDAKGWGTHCAAIHGGIKSLGCVAGPFQLFFPVPERWVPRPCIFCKGGRRCCLYHFVGHAQRLASHLRRPSPALYYLLVPWAIAFSARPAQLRPLPGDSGTGTPTLSLRGRGLRCHARTHPPAVDGTGSRNSLDRDAGVEAAHRPRHVAEEKTSGPTATRLIPRRGAAARVLAGALLRFQCLDDEEAGRKTEVHASESGETRARRVPRAMALEQLPVLSAG